MHASSSMQSTADLLNPSALMESLTQAASMKGSTGKNAMRDETVRSRLVRVVQEPGALDALQRLASDAVLRDTEVLGKELQAAQLQHSSVLDLLHTSGLQTMPSGSCVAPEMSSALALAARQTCQYAAKVQYMACDAAASRLSDADMLPSYMV